MSRGEGAALTLAEAHTKIEKLIELGEPFEGVETAIERLDRPEDEKAALWLLAWSTEERSVRQRVAREALAGIENGT
jgi:hypothetical protein